MAGRTRAARLWVGLAVALAQCIVGGHAAMHRAFLGPGAARRSRLRRTERHGSARCGRVSRIGGYVTEEMELNLPLVAARAYCAITASSVSPGVVYTLHEIAAMWPEDRTPPSAVSDFEHMYPLTHHIRQQRVGAA